MKSVPVSIIDALLAELEIGNNYCYECGIDYQEYTREKLEEIKKSSEETIPISKVEAKIKELEDDRERLQMETTDFTYSAINEEKIEVLKELLPKEDAV